jgi:catechol 2,3-dioxygenase-like lactoylglutathione lyase family enzyme
MDMFDHVAIRARDRAASEGFFAALLTALEVELTASNDHFAMWRKFILSSADAERAATHAAHVAFVAPSRAHVEDFWEAGNALGGGDDGAPGPRPQHGDGGYAALVTDPDGNTIEAIARREPAAGSLIDHVTIDAGDLAASSAFYGNVAGALGFDVREQTPRQTTFAFPGAGEYLVVGAGAPTTSLHVAFAGSDEAIQEFHHSAVAAGYRDNGAPGERAHYHPGYYAAFILDPAGNNIEVVDHHRP